MAYNIDETLSQTLGFGNTTGGNNIVISAGQAFAGVDGTVGSANVVRGGNGSAGVGGLLTIEGGNGAGLNFASGGLTASTGSSSGNAPSTMSFLVAPIQASGSGTNTAATAMTLKSNAIGKIGAQFEQINNDTANPSHFSDTVGTNLAGGANFEFAYNNTFPIRFTMAAATPQTGFTLAAARGTLAAATSVVSGDVLGQIAIQAATTSGPIATAINANSSYINFEVEGTVSSGIAPGRIRIATTDATGTQVARLCLDSAGIWKANSAVVRAWVASATDPSGSPDAGISRLGSNSLAIGNGTAGNASGTLRLTTLQAPASTTLNLGGGAASQVTITSTGDLTATTSNASSNGAIVAVGPGTNQKVYLAQATATSNLPSGIGGSVILGRPTDNGQVLFWACTAQGTTAASSGFYSQGGTGGGFSSVGSRTRLGGDGGIVIRNNESLANFFGTANGAGSPVADWYFSGDHITFTASSGGVIGFTAGSDAQAAADNGWSRLGAASSALGNGTAGDFSGTLKLTTLTVQGKVGTYNGVATAGWGIPAIYGSGRQTAQTAADASVATYTVGASDGSFLVSANVNVTTYTSGTFTTTVSYTDETNTPRTLTLNFSTTAGVLGTAIAAAGAFEGVPLRIRAKAATSITVATTGTFTSLTYNVEADITQVS